MARLRERLRNARERARLRLAPDSRIRKRANEAARSKLRTRLAGQLGARYSELPVGERIAIDRMLEKKSRILKKMAQRMIPRVKRAEVERLARARAGSMHESQEGDRLATVALATSAVASMIGLRAMDSDRFVRSHPDLRARMKDVLAKMSSIAVSDPSAVQRAIRDGAR